VRIYDLGGQRPYLRSTQAVPQRLYLHVLASDNGQKTAYLWREGKTALVRIADATTGTMVTPARLDFELQPVARTPAAWHSNGQELVVHDLETVKIIDARTGKIRKERRIPVSAVGYVDHGKRIVASRTEGTVSLWDAHTLDLLGTVATSTEGKPGGVHPTFTGGSDVVTIAAYDGNTYQWDTRINQTIAHACAMAGRNLTPDEWTQPFGNRPYEETCP
jgi:WD40 repeat protein